MQTAKEIKRVGTGKNNAKIVQEIQKSEECSDANTFEQKVEKKAYELYEKNGCQSGRDFDDWMEAQKIVKAEMIEG